MFFVVIFKKMVIWFMGKLESLKVLKYVLEVFVVCVENKFFEVFRFGRL